MASNDFSKPGFKEQSYEELNQGELDHEELFHLGMVASERGDHDKAILYFKRSNKAKSDPRTLYLLAAEYAEIGMMERAISGMQEALEIEPELWTARFQLGLAYLTQDRAEEALDAWEALNSLERNNYLRLFAEGLSALIEGHIETAIDKLRMGIASNTSNPSLNDDMMKIINAQATAVNDVNNSQEPKADETADSGSRNQRVFLSAYHEEQ